MTRYFSIISLLSALLAVAEPLSFDLATSSGWNLVAVPISIADDPDTLFAPGPAWEWTGARFETAETIVPGKAYWVHQSAARSSRTVTGAPVEVVTRELQAGWNLIGGIGYPPYAALPLPLSVSPPGSVSAVWGWENGEYVKLSQLSPGHGAWVFAKRDCTIRLSPNPDPAAINLAYSNGSGQMRLQWTTPTDDDSEAADFSYAIYGAPTASRDALIAPEHLLATRVGSQSAILSGLSIDTAYSFAVVASDGDGNAAYFHPNTRATVLGAPQTVDSSTGGELSNSGASIVIPAAYLNDPDGNGVATTLIGTPAPTAVLADEVQAVAGSATTELSANAIPDDSDTDAVIEFRVPISAARDAHDPAYTVAVVRVEYYNVDNPDQRYAEELFGVPQESAARGVREFIVKIPAAAWGATKATARATFDAAAWTGNKIKVVTVATVVFVGDAFVWTARKAAEIRSSVYRWTSDQLDVWVDLSIARWDPVQRRFWGESTAGIDDRQVVILLHGWQTLAGFGQDREAVKAHIDTWTHLVNYATGAGKDGTPDLRDDYVFYTVRYDSDKRIYDNAAAIRQLLSERFPDRKVTILAHSMGGLVARATERKYHPKDVAFAAWPNGGVERIVSLNTPYHGTPFVQFVHNKIDGATLASLATGNFSTAASLQGGLAFFALSTPGTFDLAWDNFNNDSAITDANTELLALNQDGPQDLRSSYYTLGTRVFSPARGLVEWGMGKTGPLIVALGYSNDGIVPTVSSHLNGYNAGFTTRTTAIGASLPDGLYHHLKVYTGDATGDFNDDNYDERVFDQILAALSGGPRPPLTATYVAIDLSAGANAASYPVSTLSAIPDPVPDTYKTSKLLLRRIPAGTFTMGSPSDELGWFSNETQHSVTLTQDFYVGVFEVTQRQWELVMGNRPAYFSSGSWEQRPVEQVSYDDIRGSSAGAGWPAGNGVDAASFLGRLRARTSHAFDLPTEAQWEYACRAGTTSALNNGSNLQSTSSDPNMDLLGRYWYNGGSNYSSDPISGGSAVVGSYAPNQWGLYDMHGNVWEWCLDWYQSALGTSAVSDPVGASSGSGRVVRGGSWDYDAGAAARRPAAGAGRASATGTSACAWLCLQVSERSSPAAAAACRAPGGERPGRSRCRGAAAGGRKFLV